jgi:alkanesulfonate monooxygenase SsuD/methylene tetrahydromethanopterin reductase-like flavin-dependent oxidoreductase (luciferase family)
MRVHGAAVRAGIHSGQLHGTYEVCLELATRAEELGYDWISLIDHFRPHVYAADCPCFEGTTLLAAIAARTTTIRCALLVSAITWRHPAILANVASTIDHISNGRLEFGIGAAEPDRAYDEYGIGYPPAPVRLDMLDEACTILRSLWTQECTSFDGKHYHLDHARLAPKPVQDQLPLVVGGDGLRRPLRIAARHADIWNTLAVDAPSYQRKAEAFDAHCAAQGRDSGDVRRSVTFRAVLGLTNAAASDRAASLLAGVPAEVRGEYLSVGTPDRCLADLRRFVELGAGDFLLAVKPPIDWLTVELFAGQVAPRLRS